MEEQDNDTNIEAPMETLSKSIKYTIIVPVFIVACLATFIVNLVIILAYPLIRNLSSVTRPYVTFILSLLISDAFASLLLGIQLLFGAYLPVVHDIVLSGCLLFVCEAFKLAGIIVTVFHLLVMVMIHLAGVTYPVKFKENMTQRLSRSLVAVLWLIPFSIVLIVFSSISGQGFQSHNCQQHDFLLNLPFRAVYCSFILIPILLILVIYGYFHFLLWVKRDVTKSTVSRQNIKAAKTTLLIMFTCTCGWLPAVVNHLLICYQGCRYQSQDFAPNTLFLMHSISYILVIFKSFSNPLIFAVRQKNIRQALKRLAYLVTHCHDDVRGGITRNASTYSSIVMNRKHSVRLSQYRKIGASRGELEKASIARQKNVF